MSRRRCTALLLAVLLTPALGVQASAQGLEEHAGPSSSNTLARANAIMSMTYQEFATTPREQPFDWTTDGCSHALADPDMTPACVQHDFGYRNYGSRTPGGLKLDPTRKAKNWIDTRFGEEIQRICDDKYQAGAQWERCRNNASTMLFAVRVFGDGEFFGPSQHS